MKNDLKILLPAGLVIIGVFLFWPQAKYFVSVPVLLIAALLIWPHGRYLFLRAVAPLFPVPKLAKPVEEPNSVEWFDDYFTVEYIDSETIAIGEPRYHQQNYSYLILGDQRALLFDSGPGIRDIKPLVESLTKLPIVVSQSHMHYDHIGNHHKFRGTALPDLAQFRRRAASGRLRVQPKEHLGFVEQQKAPTLEVMEWWALDSTIDLGNRTLTVLHTPGHSQDSISLLDSDRQLLFTGDFICPGPNATMVPGGNLEDYLKTTRRLLSHIPRETRLLAAHRDKATESSGAPVLGYGDLVALEHALKQISAGKLKGKGYFIYSYPVNERIRLIADR